ncbi:MAG: CRTAC1 family protein [Acidobacteriota bacterium]
MAWSRQARIGPLLIVLSVGIHGCSPDRGAPDSEIQRAQPAESGAKTTWFQQVTVPRGIDFRHQDGRTGRRYYIETAASGGGFFDYDADGDLDIYLINGTLTPRDGALAPRDEPLSPEPTTTAPPRNALYENDGTGRFSDVTEAAGVGDLSYGMGMCVGDYDSDGQLDFLVTNYGPDRLFRNLGGDAEGAVRFEETSEDAGVAGARWGTNCTFIDLDADGDLDLYVTNYVDFRFEETPRCGDPARGVWSYCRPPLFEGQADYLYINQGDGTFREEGRERGIDQGTEDRGFGVLASDLDGDGAPEILVANDGTLNRLYVNDGSGYFTDQALTAGVAADRNGAPGSGMGMDLGDANGDGRLDLLVTNYSFETNTLYLRRGAELYFEDSTTEAGLVAASYLPVGWGVQFFDADNDGDLDLTIANGHVMDNIELFEDSIGYAQSNLLLENNGTGRFRDVSTAAGSAFTTARVSRALASGDFDDDGRLDLLVTNTNDAPDLLRNTLETPHHWLGLRLRGPADNRFAIGARVSLTCGEQPAGTREVRSGGSFLAQSDLRLHFGLGRCTGPASANIRWPDGALQTSELVAVDRYLEVEYAPTNGPSAVRRSR